MKLKYISMLATAILTMVAANSCAEKEAPVQNPVISVDTESFQAGAEVQVIRVAVKANCDWVVIKENYEGKSTSWIQTDMQKGSGDADLGIRVMQNKSTEKRVGQVVLEAVGAKAFITVTQAGADPKEEPVEPPVDPVDPTDRLVLSFDFTISGLGWPTKGSGADWSGLKDLDSGCASDNGGTATDNPHRRATVTYPLNGVNYDFIFADPDNAANHNIYLSEGKGVYSGTRRQFGLPAIEGKKLVKLVMVQGASDKDPATFKRNVGLTTEIYEATVDVNTFTYIDGGEPQNQYTNMGVYTYEFSDTEANTVYYLSSPTNASIIVSMELTYDDAGTPGPKPEEPQEKELTFSFTGDAQSGWPTTNWGSGYGQSMTCTYVLSDTESYQFELIEPGFATGGKIFWKTSANYFFIGKYRYFGLPVISGYALQKVDCTVGKQVDGSAIAIMDHVYSPSSAADPDSYAAPAQAWNVAAGTVMTYELNATSASQQYYIYCKNPSGGTCFSELTLYYSKVN